MGDGASHKGEGVERRRFVSPGKIECALVVKNTKVKLEDLGESETELGDRGLPLSLALAKGGAPVEEGCEPWCETGFMLSSADTGEGGVECEKLDVEKSWFSSTGDERYAGIRLPFKVFTREKEGIQRCYILDELLAEALVTVGTNVIASLTDARGVEEADCAGEVEDKHLALTEEGVR